jgi:hypothetical protein
MDTHNTERCWKLKEIAREKELSEKKAPYPKRTFCKEVNAFACRAGKNGDIKIVEKAIKREQGKHGKKEKKQAKVAHAKKVESIAAQTPPMNPLMLWNLVKGFLARKDMGSILSDLTLRGIKLTSKILIWMMITKCLLKSAVKT